MEREHGYKRSLLILYVSLAAVTTPSALQPLTGRSMAAMFFITSGLFLTLASHGATLRRRLVASGPVLFVGLAALVLLAAVALLWPNAPL